MADITNQTLERYILKCMYNAPTSIVEISQSLKAVDFSYPAHRYLFVAIKHISVYGDVTCHTIMQHLEAKNHEAYEFFKSRGGALAIEKVLLDETIPENPQIEEQITELKQLTYRRKAVDVAGKIKLYAEHNGDIESGVYFEDIEELDEKIKEVVYSLADSLRSKEKIVPIGNAIDNLRAEIAQGATMGIDLGYYEENGKRVPYMPKLNKAIKRLRDGALYVFGAPEKVGKSTFMLEIAWHCASRLNIPVGYSDTEMTTEEVLLRLCSKVSGVEEDKIADNFLTASEAELVNDAWEHIKTVPFYHFNANLMTNSELESRVKLLQLQHGIRLFVYDYVKIQAHEAEKGRTDLILASKLDTLKEKICKQCQIPVITSGQMYPKNANDERGKYNKFCETSHFTKLADVICRLDRVTDEDMDMDLIGCSHYIELITGRKVRSDLIGTKIGFNFSMETHSVKETP